MGRSIKWRRKSSSFPYCLSFLDIEKNWWSKEREKKTGNDVVVVIVKNPRAREHFLVVRVQRWIICVCAAPLLTPCHFTGVNATERAAHFSLQRVVVSLFSRVNSTLAPTDAHLGVCVLLPRCRSHIKRVNFLHFHFPPRAGGGGRATAWWWWLWRQGSEKGKASPIVPNRIGILFTFVFVHSLSTCSTCWITATVCTLLRTRICAQLRDITLILTWMEPKMMKKCVCVWMTSTRTTKQATTWLPLLLFCMPSLPPPACWPLSVRVLEQGKTLP